MNSVTWILIGESFLILVSLVIAIAVYTWRKKRRLLTALDVLLTNLSNAEPERKATLTERLKIASEIDEAKANLLRDEIFCAERQFIQELVQLLLSSRSDKIVRFNEDMYALLAPYWELLPLDAAADGVSVEQREDSGIVSPESPESESGGLASEDYDIEVSVATAAAEDSETESTSTLKDSSPDIETNEDDVVISSEVGDQPLSTQDLNESHQSQDADQSMPVSPAEGLSTGIVEDEDLAEETTDSVEAEEDEPSWDEAFDEAAQAPESKAINLDENEDGKSKKVPEF